MRQPNSINLVASKFFKFFKHRGYEYNAWRFINMCAFLIFEIALKIGSKKERIIVARVLENVTSLLRITYLVAIGVMSALFKNLLQQEREGTGHVSIYFVFIFKLHLTCGVFMAVAWKLGDRSYSFIKFFVF